MTNPRIETLEDVRDVESLNYYAAEIARGRSPFDVLRAIDEAGRDNARAPLQWDETEHAGFTTGTPWMPVDANHTWLNARAQYDDETSVFNVYRRLIALRKHCATVVDGDFAMVRGDDPHLYVFSRRLGGHQLLVVANFSATEQDWPAEVGEGDFELVLGNVDGAARRGGTAPLRPWEARILSSR